jgi:hypothetical protein
VRVAITLKNACKPHWSALALAALLWAAGTQSMAATLYKWVDENGSVHYGNSLPPDQSNKRHQQLNSQGMVLTTTNAARSPQEMAEEAEKQRKLEEQQAEDARLKRIQDDKDRVLLLTFSNEEELEHVRDNRIEVIDSVIRLIESSIESTQGKLDKLLDRAEQTYTSQGKPVPGGLAQKIEHFERKIGNRTEQLEAKIAERDKIREKYELDLERFRLLKSASN